MLTKTADLSKMVRYYLKIRPARAERHPKKCAVVSPEDPMAYILSRNLYRRQLTASQRTMVGARARIHYDRPTCERFRRARVGMGAVRTP